MPARLLVLLASAAVLLTAGFATASEPSSGKVSASSPRFDWKGESNGYGYYNYARLARIGGQQPRCDAPACDEFTLEVADSADLTISATYETTTFMDFDIILPDGSSQYVDGGDEENHTTVAKIKKAKPGTYLIRIMTNGPANVDGAFTAFAQLAVPAPASGAPAPGAPAPAPGGPAPAPGGPAPAPGGPAPAAPAPAASSAQLVIGTRRASLRKLKKRKLAVAVSTSAPVTNVQAFLRKGKKVVAKGKLAKLGAKGKVTLKLSKKVKPGRYVLGLSAKTSSGGRAAASAPITIKR